MSSSFTLSFMSPLWSSNNLICIMTFKTFWCSVLLPSSIIFIDPTVESKTCWNTKKKKELPYELMLENWHEIDLKCLKMARIRRARSPRKFLQKLRLESSRSWFSMCIWPLEKKIDLMIIPVFLFLLPLASQVSGWPCEKWVARIKSKSSRKCCRIPP